METQDEMALKLVEQYLKRGGKIRKVDFSNAYGPAKKRHNLAMGQKMTKIEKQKKRDANNFRGTI